MNTIQTIGQDVKYQIKREGWAFSLLLTAAFAAAFSMPLARCLLALSGAGLLIQMIAAPRRPTVTMVTWLALGFVAVAILATLFGTDPERGLHKLDKLAWYLAIPLTTLLATSSPRRLWLLRAYAIGGGVLSLDICLTRPWEARQLVAGGFMPDMIHGLIHVGSMTDGQRLMIAILITLGFLMVSGAQGRKVQLGWGGLCVLLLVAFVLNFKRGSWLCGIAFIVALVGLRTNWRWLVVTMVIGIGFLALPPVQTRLQTLDREFRVPGGRMTMWTKIAPALVREHPWGIGFRSLTNRQMRAIAPEVEPGRDHLHSNLVQVLVATGWLGLGIYALWMAWALRDGWRCWRGHCHVKRSGIDRPLGVAYQDANHLIHTPSIST